MVIDANSLERSQTRAVLNVVEAADYLRVSRRTIYELIARGRLRPRKILGRTVFRREDLDRIIA